MNTWNDIYDFSEKVLSYILRKKEEEYIQPDQDSPVEKMADKLGNSETLAERLQQQYRYDPIRAYRKLKNYRRRRRIRRYSVAAGILLVLGLGWGWFHQNSPGDPLLLTQTIQPGGKKAVLTLADGSVWHIGDSAMLIPTAQNHIRIDSSGMLLQAGKEGKTENTETYHLLSIPRGGEFTMTLADGTRVWLNSESELHFPLQFGGEQRIVQLTGEAYFEVAKDAAHPFVVEVCDSKIQVLGTGFNVRSYSEEGQIVTTLVEGAVCFESIEDRVILKPGEQSILDKEGQLQKRVVEVYPFVAWKEGRFIFRKQRLEDIMVMVSRWYNVEVYFEDDESKEITFSGGMMRNDGFEALMKMIETVGSINCTIKDNTVFIAKRK